MTEPRRINFFLPRMVGKTQFKRWVAENDPTWAEAQAEALRRFGKREDATLVILDELTREDDA